MVKTQTVTTDSGENPNVENPGVTRTVHYRHGMMRRKDSLGAGTIPSIAEIANCETKTGFLIDLNAHEYRKYKLVRFASEAQRGEYLQKTGKTAVQVESRTVDTGERKVFFGHLATRLITTTKRADANSRGGEEIIDGWYIDHELPDHNCAPDFVRSEPYYVIGSALVDYPDVAQVRHTGPLPTGLAVRLKLTGKLAATKDGTPGRTITIEETVEELSDAPLSASLFQLPNGLHENSQLFQGHISTPMTNLVVIAFLALVAIWLFARRGERRDRVFLGAASLIYIAAMAVTAWKFGTDDRGRVTRFLLLETAGFLLVMLSRIAKKKSK